MTKTAAARPHTPAAMRARRKAKPAASALPSPTEPTAAAPPSAEPTAPPAPERGPNKLETLTGLLQRPEGARLPDLCAATGWQAHSVRGALAGALKTRGLTISSEKTDGGRVYRAVAPPAQAAGA